MTNLNYVGDVLLKVKFAVFILLFFFFFSCSSGLDATYGNAHIPPPASKGSSTTGKNAPATQKPYRIKGVKYSPIASAQGFVQKGKASWYGKKFHGRKTSNGEVYNMYAMTAAHKTLPMNTWVSVHNLENNKKIVVRVNDRGPFIYGRIIDLSYTGASRLGIVGPGTAKVRITALGQAVSYSKKTKAPVKFQAMDYWKGDFTVQVGAFKVKSNAQNYRTKLSKSYKNVHIAQYTDHRGVFYRVRVGRFTNLKDAMRFTEKMILNGFDNAFAIAR